jgi:hypothetical protein
MAGIGWRFLFAFALICFTWNPTRYNYIAWAIARVQDRSLLPLVAFVGVVLLIGWVFYLRSTARSLGTWGIFLAAGLAATVFWVLIKYVVDMSTHTLVIQWIALALLAAILTAGMSWSHLRRGWAGQADVDDVDNRH